VIQEQQMKIQLEACEEKLMGCEERLTVVNDKLNATEEKMKTQGQLLDLAQQVLSKRELSSSIVVSSTVANAVALMKNQLPDLDMEILCKEFTVDDAEQETLVNNVYDAAQDFVSLYDFSLLNLMIILVPVLILYAVINFLLVNKNIELILLNT
jgi:hypothetical protein